MVLKPRTRRDPNSLATCHRQRPFYDRSFRRNATPATVRRVCAAAGSSDSSARDRISWYPTAVGNEPAGDGARSAGGRGTSCALSAGTIHRRGSRPAVPWPTRPIGCVGRAANPIHAHGRHSLFWHSGDVRPIRSMNSDATAKNSCSPVAAPTNRQRRK